ncbi:MAG: hypothetical protein ACYDC2_11695 [Solirubrobacteraceae bacterium]
MAKKKPSAKKSKPHVVKKVPPAGVKIPVPDDHVPLVVHDPDAREVRVVPVHRDVVRDPTFWERVHKFFSEV